MRRKEGDSSTYGIYEVYYNDLGQPTACSENPVEPFGETFEELCNDLRYFTAAMEKPVLDYDNFINFEKGL
jgi:hypothetical protein